MSFLPNSRFMNEFAVIMPTKPAGVPLVGRKRQLEEALGERHAERVLHVAASCSATDRAHSAPHPSA